MEAGEVSMVSKQYTDEFEAEAVKQVAQRGLASLSTIRIILWILGIIGVRLTSR